MLRAAKNRCLVLVTLFVFGLCSAALGQEAVKVIEKAKVATVKKANAKANAKAKEKTGEKKDAKADGKKEKKKAGGAAIKALFKAFVPAPADFAVNVAQPKQVKQVSIEKLGGITEENVKKLEETLKKNRNAQAHIKRFEPRFKQLCQAELRFVHEVCNLTRPQFDTIQATANLASRACALEAAQYQAGMENGWQGRRPDQPNPFVLIEDTLMAAVQKTLPPKQASAYQQEIESRRTFQKVADAEKIVSALDKDLGLSEEQRTELVKPIAEAWKYSWKGNLQLLDNNGNQYLPQLPRTAVRKILTKEQRVTFTSMGRHGGKIFFDMQLNDLPRVNRQLAKLEEELEFATEDDPS